MLLNLPMIYFIGVIVFVLIAIITTRNDLEAREPAVSMSVIWPLLVVFTIFDVIMESLKGKK
jgi:hypothetical protein